MVKRIYIDNNYLVIANNEDISYDTRNLSSNIYVEINGNIFIFYRLSDNYLVETISFSDIVDADGNAYDDVDTFLSDVIYKTGKPDSIDVNVQDQSTDILDYYFRRDLNVLTFDGTQTIDLYTINVVDASAVTVGNLIRVQEENRLFQAKILSINVNEITLDTPIDYAFTSSAVVAESTPDMNVDGSTTPIVFSLEPDFDYKWDVVRVIFSMTHSAAGDDSKFGSVTSLAKGVVLRKSNDVHHTIFNVKNNGEVRLRSYDLAYSDKAGGGNYGTSFRRTFGGQNKNGVVIRLDGSKNESLQIIIQDDLTGLISLNAVLQGHLVED